MLVNGWPFELNSLSESCSLLWSLCVAGLWGLEAASLSLMSAASLLFLQVTVHAHRAVHGTPA